MAVSLVRIAPDAAPKPVHYPTSDGRPMAETDVHRQCMFDAIETLEDFFVAADNVYVSGNLLLYYEQGNPRRSVAPDVFVVRGVPKRSREIYKLWEEQEPPAFVLEITSRSTRRQDLRTKRSLYERLGVAEYFLFDPLGEYLRPPLQGNTLAAGSYQPIAPESDGGLPSAVLGLRLRFRDGALHFFDPRAGRWLPTRAEARQEAETARLAAEARASAAEAEAAHLRAELARLRSQLT